MSGQGEGDEERPVEHSYLSQALQDQWESDIQIVAGWWGVVSIISDKESTVDTALEMGLEHDSVGNSSV